MPRKSAEVTIDGHTYRVKQVGAETGDAILFRLGRGLAMSDLSPKDYEFVRNIFKANTDLQIVDTKGDGRKNWAPLESAYDDHFAGRYEALMEWLQFAFSHNFGNFLGAVSKLVGTQAAVANFISPTGARGGSGESSQASTSGSEASPS